jgi:hypothetical protein
MNFEPSTPEEAMKLSQALINGARVEIETRVVAVALDEEAIKRQALDRIEKASFEDAKARTRVLERVQTNECKQMWRRRSSYKVRILPDSAHDRSREA